MTKYTKNNKDEIYFLNDKNIAQSLSDDISFNPIPSLSLLNTVNDNLIEKIDNDIQNISSDLSANNGEFIIGIKQEFGKLSSITTSKLTDDFIDNEKISISKISGLTNSLDDLSSNYVKKSGDNIDSLLINNNLSVDGQIINKNISTDTEGNVTIQGNYSDEKHGSLNLNFEDGLDDIKINDKPLFETLQELSSTTINSLNKELTNIRKEYLLSSKFKTSEIYNDKGFVTGGQLSARYVTTSKGTPIIEISLDSNKQEIDCTAFIKDGMISEVKVEDGNLIITWNTDSVKDPTKIPLSQLANIYKWGSGIKESDFNINIDDSIVVTHDQFEDTETYVEQLKTNIINELSNNIKYSLACLKHTVKFDGIIEHYESGCTFKELFDSNTDYNGLKGSVRNNSLYKVNILENNKYNISSVFEVEGLSFTNSDYLFISEKTDENQIPTDVLKLSSIYVIKTGVSKIDFDTEIFDRISVDNKLSNWCSDLSSVIDTKTSVSSDNGLLLGLSIKNISEKDYHDLVISRHIDLSTLYIVSSDVTNVHGERIINLHNPIELSDAVNKKYVDEHDNELSNWCSDLSSVIDTKTSVSSDNGLLLGLSIKNISEKDYHDLAISGHIDPSTLYIVSSDIINAYGVRIINVADPVDFNDATNKTYVDNKLLNLVQICTNLTNSVQQSNNNVNTLKNNNSNIIRSINQDTSLSVLLTDETDLENKISNSDIIRALQIILKNINMIV